MHRSLDTAIWTDPRLRGAPFEAKGLYAYLVTNQHAHICGLYYLPRVLMMHETALPADRLENRLGHLIDRTMIELDDPNDLVLVMDTLHLQGFKRELSDRLVPAILKQLHAFDFSPLVSTLLHHYQDWRALPGRKATGKDPVSIPYLYGIDTGIQKTVDSKQKTVDSRQKKREVAAQNVASPFPTTADIDEFIQGYNTICASEGMPEKKFPTATLRDKITSRLRQHPDHSYWQHVFNKACRSTFLRGDSPQHNGHKPFRMTLDWLVSNENNAVKVYEGAYDDVLQRTGFASDASRAAARAG